jgi:GR25 family glycosyltransferase involved in LPS biosynthesis
MTPIIVLNLNRAKNRREILEAQFKNRSINDYLFFPAFDGRYITNLTFNANIGIGYGMGRPLRKTEMSIIMSHLSALKHAKMMNYDNVIILEDDVVLCEDWNERINQLKQDLPEDWGHVYLSGHSDYVALKKYDIPTIIPSPKMVGAFAYMVNSSGYDKIINFCMSFMTTYDDMIMHAIDQGKLKSYTYFPFMAFHNANDSFVWDETPGHLKHKDNMHSSYSYFKNKL